ncbi:uncharacterized protein C8A04DRAFT_36202 [Dichotomopilus funicola]|uniref:DNA mismatch repair protein MSH3 n=1 Tax=Dichotomopilus funicola TaxID=1934379 RepID=A0AAN6V4P2_9PEZI|nr:hypothetical protein C8A04DRAFT_36202 [Dichotomopilus funicola]
MASVDLSSESEDDEEMAQPHGAGNGRRRHQPHRAGHGPDHKLHSDSTQDQDYVVCAISESRSSDMVGVAIINVTLGLVDLVRIVNDDKYRRLLETLWRIPTSPQTFLVLKRVVSQGGKSTVTRSIEQEFPLADIVPLDREHWNESEGLRLVERFAWRSHVKGIRQELNHNFYVSCAFSAAMSYIEEEAEVIFRDNSLRITYKQPADTMGLDRSTITSLEIFQNIRNAKKSTSTLFGLLNHTLTPQGRRMVRSALLQPSTNRDIITMRHEAVEELSSNEDLFTEVRSSLKQLLHIDVERSVPWVSTRDENARIALQEGISMVQGRHQFIIPSHEELRGAEKDLNQILMIKAYLGGLQAVRETLEVGACTSELCQWVLERLQASNTVSLSNLIAEAIEQDAVYSKAPIDIRNNRLWAIKAEPNSVLEGSRQRFRNCTDELHHYVEELSKVFQEQLGATPELRLGNDNHYYLRFQWTDVERALIRDQATMNSGHSGGVQHWIPRLLVGIEIVNGVRRKHHYDCQTLELIQRSSQIQRHADIVTTQSDGYAVAVKAELLGHAETLLGVDEAIAMLDMVCSFAYLATTQNYVRPLISDDLVLKAARHPVMEVRKDNFVPNDIYLGDQGARFQVVTGGNMSGKSTLIRSIALIQIMVQIGSFVPATYAAVPICDRVFTRLSTEDKPESNMGTFAVEMSEMNMILRQVTKHSMVIIDELGRGTSTTEGLGIALSICEALVKEESRVFFATHFTEIARVLNATHRTRVSNVHIAGGIIEDGPHTQISLPHTVAPGPVRNEDYGSNLARRFLPARVVNNAENACKFLRLRHLSRGAGPATHAGKQNKLILALPGLLKQAHVSTMDDSALASYLKKLQTEFTIRMDATHDEAVPDTLPHGDTGQDTTIPILERPSEEEVEEWRQKCDFAETRVMHANTTQEENQNVTASSPDSGAMYSLKSSDYNSILNDHAGGELSSPLTPVNRSSMLEKIQQQLRKTTCTPATTWAATPSSMTSEASYLRAESHRENRPP